MSLATVQADGIGVAPYRYVTPPKFLRSTNQPPQAGAGSVRLSASGQQSVYTRDIQAGLSFGHGAFGFPSGQRSVHIAIRPLHKFPSLPKSFMLDGNVYEFRYALQPSNRPIARSPGRVLFTLVAPHTPTGMLGLIGGRWRVLCPQILLQFTISSVGCYTHLLPREVTFAYKSVVVPPRHIHKHSARFPAALIIAAVAVVVLVAFGLFILLRRGGGRPVGRGQAMLVLGLMIGGAFTVHAAGAAKQHPRDATGLQIKRTLERVRVRVDRDFGASAPLPHLRVLRGPGEFRRALLQMESERSAAGDDEVSNVFHDSLVVGTQVRPLPHVLAHVYTEWLLDNLTRNTGDRTFRPAWLYDGIAEQEANRVGGALPCRLRGRSFLARSTLASPARWSAIRTGPLRGLEYCEAELAAARLERSTPPREITRLLRQGSWQDLARLARATEARSP